MICIKCRNVAPDVCPQCYSALALRAINNQKVEIEKHLAACEQLKLIVLFVIDLARRCTEGV